MLTLFWVVGVLLYLLIGAVGLGWLRANNQAPSCPLDQGSVVAIWPFVGLFSILVFVIKSTEQMLEEEKELKK
jgi:hypothetical protein